MPALQRFHGGVHFSRASSISSAPAFRFDRLSAVCLIGPCVSAGASNAVGTRPKGTSFILYLCVRASTLVYAHGLRPPPERSPPVFGTSATADGNGRCGHSDAPRRSFSNLWGRGNFRLWVGRYPRVIQGTLNSTLRVSQESSRGTAEVSDPAGMPRRRAARVWRWSHRAPA